MLARSLASRPLGALGARLRPSSRPLHKVPWCPRRWQVQNDIDGTIAGNGTAVTRAAAESLAHVCGPRPVDPAEVRSTFARCGSKVTALRHLIAIRAPGASAAELDARARAAHALFERKVLAYSVNDSGRLHPEVLPAMERVRSRLPGVSFATTSGFSSAVGQRIRLLLVEQGYSDAGCAFSDQVPEGEAKPRPGMLLRCMRAEGLEPHQVVKVGDNVADVQEARAAGSWSVAVVRNSSMRSTSSGDSPSAQQRDLLAVRNELARAGAHAVVLSYAEVPDALFAFDDFSADLDPEVDLRRAPELFALESPLSVL